MRAALFLLSVTLCVVGMTPLNTAFAYDDDDLGSELDADGETIHFDLPALPNLRTVGCSVSAVCRIWEVRTVRTKLRIEAYARPPAQICVLDPAQAAIEELRGFQTAARGYRYANFVRHEYIRAPDRGLGLAYLGTGPAAHVEDGEGRLWVFACLLKNRALTVSVLLLGDPPPDIAEAVERFARDGVRVATTAHDPRWSDDDVRFWASGAIPAALHPDRFRAAARTKHYIIISDAAVPPSFGSMLEATYEAVRRLAPFPDMAGRSLLPVLILGSKDEYAVYAPARGHALGETTLNTTGHTSVEAATLVLDDYAEHTLRHEATHQLFQSRVFLFGGGSWFHEGLAEYFAFSPEERRANARSQAAKGLIPLRTLVRTEVLAKFAGNRSGTNAYLQAGCLVAFLCEGKWKAKFPELLRKLGSIAWNLYDAEIDAIESTYGTTLEGIDAEFLKYCQAQK